MSARREAIEDDFRSPEFYGAKLADYEIREDGKAVRKDRWETAVRNIATALGMGRKKWEIEDIIAAVDQRVEITRTTTLQEVLEVLGDQDLDDKDTDNTLAGAVALVTDMLPETGL